MSPLEEQFDCAECVDAAPYVLGALAEPDAYREHLATCAICQAEVARLQPVADTLPTTVRPETAPPAMRQRVLTAVGQTRQFPPEGRTTSVGNVYQLTRRQLTRPLTVAAMTAMAAARPKTTHLVCCRSVRVETRRYR